MNMATTHHITKSNKTENRLCLKMGSNSWGLRSWNTERQKKYKLDNPHVRKKNVGGVRTMMSEIEHDRSGGRSQKLM